MIRSTWRSRLLPAITLAILAGTLAACGDSRIGVTIQASLSGQLSPFRDGSRQTYEILGADGRAVASGVHGPDVVSLVLEPGTYQLVSQTVADGSVQLGGQEPVGPGKQTVEPRTGTEISGRLGLPTAKCDAQFVVAARPVVLAIEALRPVCVIEVTYP